MPYVQKPGAVVSDSLGGQYQNEGIDAYYANLAAEQAAELTIKLEDFESKYLGAYSVDPSVDANGKALIEGALYFNTVQLSLMTYYAGAWHSWSAGTTGSTPYGFENRYNVVTNWTIADGNNAVSAGPMVVADGVVVTVPSGSVWVVV